MKKTKKDTTDGSRTRVNRWRDDYTKPLYDYGILKFFVCCIYKVCPKLLYERQGFGSLLF